MNEPNQAPPPPPEGSKPETGQTSGPPPEAPRSESGRADAPPPGGSPPFSGHSAGAKPVRPYLIESILVTICCCSPFGIAGIVFAVLVNKKQQEGDRAGAEQMSNWALAMCALGIAAGLSIYTLGLIGWLPFALIA